MDSRKNTDDNKMFCAIDINSTDNKTIDFDYHYGKDSYKEESVKLNDVWDAFENIEDMINRYNPTCCGPTLYSSGLYNINFCIQEKSGSIINEIFKVEKNNATIYESLKTFKKVEVELLKFLDVKKKSKTTFGYKNK